MNNKKWLELGLARCYRVVAAITLLIASKFSIMNASIKNFLYDIFNPHSVMLIFDFYVNSRVILYFLCSRELDRDNGHNRIIVA